jgi:CubicO group peptidase (beta-lactamase class C family)
MPSTRRVRREQPKTSSVLTRMVIAVLLVSVLTSCSAPGPRVEDRDAALASDLEAFVARLAERDEFSGAVLLARHGHPLVRRGYGLADRKSGRANTPETTFALASVSKMVLVQIAVVVFFDDTRQMLGPA